MLCKKNTEFLSIEVYGMTETSSVHTLAYPDRPIRLGSVGHPLPYSRVRIVKVDADGRLERDCVTDEIGVVAMSGPGVFSGYLNEIHNKEAFVEPGWVNSGDLGRLDEDGYLWITGRAQESHKSLGSQHRSGAPSRTPVLAPVAVLAAVVLVKPDAATLAKLPLEYVDIWPVATFVTGGQWRGGAEAYAGARCRAGVGDFDRNDAAYWRRENIQAAASVGCCRTRLYERAGASRGIGHPVRNFSRSA